MAVNKVVYGTTTIVDLTKDTIDASALLAGRTAHSATGDSITGTLSVHTIYTGSAVPASSLGENGDLYLMG